MYTSPEFMLWLQFADELFPTGLLSFIDEVAQLPPCPPEYEEMLTMLKRACMTELECIGNTSEASSTF